MLISKSLQNWQFIQIPCPKVAVVGICRKKQREENRSKMPTSKREKDNKHNKTQQQTTNNKNPKHADEHDFAVISMHYNKLVRFNMLIVDMSRPGV
jgi:hypothetical protein